MIKTIAEKEKLTFVYMEWGIPTLLIIVGILGLGAGIAVMTVLTLQTLVALLLGPIVAFFVAYVMLHQKQILMIDGTRRTIEEHLGKKRLVFNFDEVEWADVERVRDDQEEAAEEDLEKAKETTHLHLNYHPFLKLKNKEEKYFLFDNKGRGLKSHKDARSIIETINQYVGVPKLTCEDLNVYKIQPSSGSGFILLVFVLVAVLILGYFALKALGVF